MAKPSKPRRAVKDRVNKESRKKTASGGAGPKRPGKIALSASSVRPPVRDLEAGDTESYLRLRQTFDSFQAVMLYYYATGENTQQRIERAEEIGNYLRSFTRTAPLVVDPDTECPPGMKPCGAGDCIPQSQACYTGDGDPPK